MGEKYMNNFLDKSILRENSCALSNALTSDLLRWHLSWKDPVELLMLPDEGHFDWNISTLVPVSSYCYTFAYISSSSSSLWIFLQNSG